MFVVKCFDFTKHDAMHDETTLPYLFSVEELL